MRKAPLNLLSFLSAVCLLLATIQLQAQTNVSGNQSGTWLKASSPYILTGAVTVPAGQTLTIQPGCKVLMPYYGYFNVNGTLIANGITTDSIRFVRQVVSGGYNYGGYFNINASSSNSAFSYVTMDSLGYNSYPVTTARSFTLTNSSIKNSSSGYPISISSDTISPTIQNCTFIGSDNNRTIYANSGSLSNVSNNTNAIIYPNGAVNQTSAWPNPGVNGYYQMSGAITVNNSRTLTIQSGCKVLMPYYGYFNVNGTLLANGTATDSIRFVRQQISGGYNYGGYFNINASSSNSAFSYVSMDSLGYNNYPITANSTLNISNSSIRNYNSHGIYTNRSISISQCAFSSQGSQYAIYIPIDTILPVIQNNTFSGSDAGRIIYSHPNSIFNVSNNVNAIVYLSSGTVNQNGQWARQSPNSHYQLNGAITINSNKALTIQPGCKVLMPYYSYFNVNGTLLANGTAADSIRFVRQQISGGYNYGGYFNINAASSNSSFDYVVMDSLGYNSYPITTARSFTLTNSSIKNSANGYPVSISSDTISPVIQNCIFIGSDNNRTIYANAGSLSNVLNNDNVIIYPYGTINQNSSWQKQGANTYFQLSGAITISNSKTLAIQPGCKVLMPYYGYFNVNGTLLANGTASDSIRFVRQVISGGYNYGGYFNFNASSANSSLSYASMDSLGYYSNFVITAIGSLSISNSSIRNYSYYGINLQRSNVTVNQCSFSSQSNSYYAIYISSDTISPTVQNNTFSGSDNGRTISASAGTLSNFSNNTNAIFYLTNGTISQNAQWQSPGTNSYYRITSSVTVSSGKTLTIQPGCRVRMDYSGYFNVNGTLIANGTATDSIYFSRYYTSSSYPYGGYFNFNASSTNSSLGYVSMDSLGYSTSVVITAAGPLSVTNSSIRNCSYYGIVITRSDVNIKNCFFSSQYYPILVNSDTISPTVQNTTFSGSDNGRTVYASAKCFSLIANNTNAILRPIGAVNANAVWPKQNANSYYQLDGSVTVNSGNVLTIEPGNLINFPSTGSNLFVNGTLRAQGTETARIQFLKLAGTGSGTYGGGIYLNAGSSNNVLSYCTLDKLGGYYGYALLVNTSNASLSNLSISNSNSYGVYLSNNASPTITSSNITSNPYGVYSASGKPVFNNCNIFANTSYGIYNASGAVADTVDARNCYWGDTSGPKHTTLNPLGLGNLVTNKVKFNPWKKQPANGQIVDLGVNAIIKPVTGCNLTTADTLRVKLTNYGNIALANFPVSYRINSGTPVTETVTASVLPGSSQEYTFTQKANLSTPGTYTLKVYTTAASDSVPGNDTAATTIQHLAGVSAPANLLPANNATNVNIPVTLNWGAVPDVESYDLYVWKTSLSVPATPSVAGLTQISYAVATNLLQYGTVYNWKVVAKRSNCRAESAVQSFTTRQLPDLVVDSISVPPTATSENNITIRWGVKNVGGGSTGNAQWNDVVYISDQPVLGVGNDMYIGQLPNFSALNTGESYTSVAVTYHIPQGTQGAFYLIIKTNYTGALKEVTDTNNLKVKLIIITLAPPPDLQVTNLVVSPSTAFSEDSATISFTVQNLGTGPTTVANWFDQIYLTTDTTLNVNAAISLFTFSRSQPLIVNGTYSVTRRIKLPAQISGTYYVHVFADRGNNVFEYTKDDNNTRRSLPMTIILRPAPNLAVSNLSVPTDTIASRQSLNVQWTTRNDGAATVKPSWYEAVYYSTTPTFNPATAVVVGGQYRYDSIASLSSIPGQQAITIPNIPEGTYYFFVRTDLYNSVFESTAENDNVSAASGPVPIVNPDLKPVNVTAPASAVSEQTFAISWTVKNDSRAGIYNSSWSDNVYLSQDTLLNSGDIALGDQNVNQFMPAGSDYTRQINVTLPQAISGNYYLLVSVGNGLFEKSKTNNIGYKAIPITLAPWPDLQVSSLSVPATDTIGSALNFQYTVQNAGSGSIVNRSWTDYVYLSSVNNVNTSSLTLLGTVSQTRSLSGGSSYTQAGNFTIPSSLGAGTYYLIVVADYTNQVFENTGESNNRTISTGIAMTSVPPIDLSVTAGQLLSNNVTAGQTATLQWTIKNNSTAATVIPTWTDAVYLSNNPILDASDIMLSTFTVSGPLNTGASYTQTRTVTIPNGVSGNLYLLVQTDKDNVHTDPNRGNNTLSVNNGSGGQTIVITVPPPADLIVPSITAPAEATAAQPITVGFTLKNNGTGITPATSWTDNVYLSTDNVLNAGDIQIGSLAHTGALAPGDQYSGTLEMTIPSNLSGNYILIIKADGGNYVYEPNKTNNLAFSSIYIAAQPPSDLIVTQINALPTQAVIGASSPFSWKLKNIGSNTASGYIKEALYLSKDTVYDPTDILMGTVRGNISLPPQADVDHVVAVQMRGVLPGYYHLLVKTDIQNNIVEQNENNNSYASIDTVYLSIRELPIDTAKYDVLVNNLASYLRIEVPDSLAGETMSVKLSGDSVRHAINRLYISYGKVPSSNNYDFTASVPFQANQEAIIPELKAGTYYLAAYGNDTATNFQQVSLFAKIIPFSISYVTANQGGNGGAVTIQINGAKFEPGITVLLLGANTITAQAVYFVNSTRLYATFNLSGAALGSYTVKLTKGTGTTTQLPNGFAVVPASPGGNGLTGGGAFTCSIQNIGYESNIETDVLAPATTRPGSLVKITIAYANNGNVDIPVPKRMLLSLTGAPLNFAPYFNQNLQQLLLVFNEADGPPDILRAGASGFIHVYTSALPSLSNLSFTVTE